MHSVHILKDAYTYYTGHPPCTVGNKGEGWTRILNLLEEMDCSPWEYLYWCAHILPGGYKPVTIIKTGWIQHTASLEAFRTWKGNHRKLLPVLVKNQRHKYVKRKKSLAAIYLLQDDRFELDPPVRCDLALKDLDCSDVILHKYQPRAEYMVRAMPEYRPLLRYWKYGESQYGQ